MSRKKIYIILASSIIAFTICFSVLYTVNAGKNTVNVGENVLFTSQKSVYDDMGDGWIYNFKIYYSDDSSNKKLYMFDGYNLKYKQLDGYYVPIVYSKTGEVIDKIIPNYITLSISEKYKSDIVNISDFFNEMQFTRQITVTDLKKLKIENFDKEYIVDIFNRTIESELQTEPGQYYESGFVGRASVNSTVQNMPGEWQASYLLDFGRIYKVNIEFINSDGTYLSDVSPIENTTLMISDIINTLETNIVNVQEINHEVSTINETSSLSTNSINSDLNRLLEKLVEELNRKEN